MDCIFSKSRVNQGRQRELDFAKGLAIIFMVLVHTGEVFQGESGALYERIVEFLGSPPAAPIFMMLLGVGIVYSRRNEAEELLKRGVKLLIAGYIFNVFREGIPYMLLAHRTGDITYALEAREYLWGIDILAFSGLTFLFFGIIKKFNIKDKYIALIWCSFAALNLVVRGVSFESSTANAVCGLFWGTYENSWFPFLTWIFYPILGYFFGKLLIRCKDKEVFYKWILVSMGSLTSILWIYAYINNVRFGAFGELYQTDYYHHDLMGNMVLGTFALFWLSICFYTMKIIPEGIFKAFARWSKNTNMIYCIHYIILGWLILVIEAEAQTPSMVMTIAICVFIVTDLICIGIGGYSKHKMQGIKPKSTTIENI